MSSDVHAPRPRRGGPIKTRHGGPAKPRHGRPAPLRQEGPALASPKASEPVVVSHDSPVRAYPLGRLFPPLAPETTKALDAYPAALRRALPLRASMERELPRQIRFLSLSLTAEREGGPKPGYLSEPRTLAAYAWYFLPWNLLRLARLLPSIDLDLPEGGLVCDLGAGPLTFVLALWLFRPDLRRKKLRFVCVDRSRRALELGLGLFTALAGFDPTLEGAPWSIRIQRGEYWQGLTAGADMVTMVNVANELSEAAGREPLDARMGRLAAQLAESVAPGGRVLVIEPGTRLGWRCLHGMREAFLEMDLAIAAPCPHGQDCPLAEGRTRAWCHFTMSLEGAPKWLAAVSERAGLGKERLSLAFLMARKAVIPVAEDAVRVVSGAFSLSDVAGSAVYGCTAKGLVVLVAPNRRPPRPGDLLGVRVSLDASCDVKSGAPRVFLNAPQEGSSFSPDEENIPARGAVTRDRRPSTAPTTEKQSRVPAKAAGSDRRDNDADHAGSDRRGRKPARSGSDRRSGKSGHSSSDRRSDKPGRSGSDRHDSRSDRSGSDRRNNKSDHSGSDRRSNKPERSGADRHDGKPERSGKPRRPGGAKRPQGGPTQGRERRK